MSCSAVVRPASPTTYAVPCGRCSARNCAVASADVQIADSGTSMPLPSSRARRSRGVKIELLVSTRKDRPDEFSDSMNSWAPGIGSSSLTRTPSMSVSQVSTGRVMAPLCRSPAREQDLDAVGGMVADHPAAEGLHHGAHLAQPIHGLAPELGARGVARAEHRDPQVPLVGGVEDDP